MLLTMLADGRLHLTAIDKLAPHLTLENRELLLERATHRSKRQILELIAEIAPGPDVPAGVRKLPERRALSPADLRVASTGEERPMLELGPESTIQLNPDPALELRPDGVAAPPPGVGRDDPATFVASPPVGAFPVSPAVVQPLSPGRYKVQFTASADFCRKLERLRILLGARGSDGDLAAVIEQAVTEKLERLEARRFAQTTAPRKGPAATVTETETTDTETETGHRASCRGDGRNPLPGPPRRATSRGPAPPTNAIPPRFPEACKRTRRPP